MIFGTALFSC